MAAPGEWPVAGKHVPGLSFGDEIQLLACHEGAVELNSVCHAIPPSNAPRTGGTA
jgi:hypothetical protein